MQGQRQQGDPRNMNGNNLTTSSDVLPLVVDPRMHLTDTERRRALAIKAAIIADSEVDESKVSDFFCVQLAIVDGDDIATSVERAHHLQMFTEEYQIQDTPEEARQTFQYYMQGMPGNILSLSFNQEEGNYVLVLDFAKLNKDWLRREENMKCILLCNYYFITAVSPDFFSIREGFYAVLECEGYNWKNFDVAGEHNKRIWEEILIPYPIFFRQMKIFNGGTLASIMVGLLKKFAPKRITEKIEMTLQFDARLDQVFFQPSKEIAQERLLARVQACIGLRNLNEQTFRLNHN